MIHSAVLFPRNAGRSLASGLLALLLFASAAPVFAEGEYWTPLYNKLARMLNERCEAAGESTVSELSAGTAVTQAHLNTLRQAVIDLAEDHYVVVAGDGSYDGDTDILYLIESADAGNDAYGNVVLKTPSLFSEAGCPNSNAFTRIPAAYGQASYSNNFTDVPVFWEHFQELYDAIAQLQWTRLDGTWTANSENNLKSESGSGTTWGYATAAADAAYDSSSPVNDSGGLAAAYYYGSKSESTGTTVFGGFICRSYGYVQVSVPSARSCEVDFYTWAVAGSYVPPYNYESAIEWDDNGDPVYNEAWSNWSTKTSQSQGTLLSDVLGSLTRPAECSEPSAPPTGYDWSSTVKGYTAGESMAIAKWSFTSWEDLTPTSIVTTDFAPPADDGGQGLCLRCMGCATLTCENEAGLPEKGNALPRHMIRLGFSNANKGPSLDAYLVSGGTSMPHAGLSAGSPSGGTVLSFSLDSRIVSDVTVGSVRYVNLLRPQGRVVTFRFDGPTDTTGIPVGREASFGGRYTLHDQGSGILDLEFSEGVIHRYSGSSLYGAAYGTSFANGEAVTGTPGLSWSGSPLSTMSTPVHDIGFTYDANGYLTQIDYERASQAVIRVTLSYSGSNVNAVEKKLTDGQGGWDTVDQAALSRGAGGNWTLTRTDPGNAQNSVASVESRSEDAQTGILLVETSRRQTLGGQQETARSSSVKYQRLPWGLEKVEATSYDPDLADPGAAGLAAEQYSYYDDAQNDGDNYGHLEQVISPDGSWTRYEYDSAGRVTKEVHCFENAAPGAAESLSRVVSFSYDTSVVSGSGDTGLQPNTPRREIVTLLGQEIARTYRVILAAESRTIRCQTAAAAWNASDNLVTIRKLYTSGDFKGRTQSIERPDGTLSLYTYSEDAQTGALTVTVDTGDPNGAGTAIEDGTRTVTVANTAGQTLSTSTYDIASSSLTAETENTQFDAFGRVTKTEYLDGSYTETQYGCCGPDRITDREGIPTFYGYDWLKRTTDITRNSITTLYAYDVDGNVLTVKRAGTDQSLITQSTSVYDAHGRLSSTTDALSNTTSFSRAFDANGRFVETTTYPDTCTLIRTANRDGSAYTVGGTGAHPVKYDYGADTAGAWTQTIRLAPGTQHEEDEWVKSYSDMIGRQYKTLYPDNAVALSYFNSYGQLWKQVDPDGIVTLYGYNDSGEREYMAVDVDQDGVIDKDGTDRITRTVSSVTTRGTDTVRRTEVSVWDTDNTDSALLISQHDAAVASLQSWSTSFGLTTHSATVLDRQNGDKTVTVTAPDGSYTVTEYDDGRLDTVTRYDAQDTQLSQVTYAYDVHGRQSSVTDARNGATSYTYNNADQVLTVTTPDPDGAGPESAQVTTYTYDSRGRTSAVELPDSEEVHTVYTATGETAKRYGARTYPVEYEYDAQGRMTLMRTWKSFNQTTGAGISGSAETAWAFDDDRGFLVSKTYEDNSSVTYSYTDAGRLSVRTWDRLDGANPLTTTYSYSAATGDLTAVDYSDSTADISYSYNRRGQRTQITDASGTRTVSYTGAGQIDEEAYTAGALSGIEIARTYDAQKRLSTVTATEGVNSVSQTTYTYDDASRLATVSDGTNTFTYGYETNAPWMVASVTGNNGTANIMTADIDYDKLNRLTEVQTDAGAAPATVSGYAYDYNDANQRTKATLADGTYWDYTYDALGQVTGGTKKLSGGTAIAGMSFGYTFDQIGNRTETVTNSREADWTANSVNQYTARDVPGYVDVLGSANPLATVTVDNLPVAWQGSLFRRELALDNADDPVWHDVNIVGVRNNIGAGGEDAVTEVVKPVFLAEDPETFTYDDDGNLLTDGRWQYTWNAENRLISMETLSGTPAGEKRKLEFTYDSQGRRVRAVHYEWVSEAWSEVSDTVFVWFDWLLVAELDANDSLSVNRTHTWGLDLSGSLQGAGGVGGLLCSTDSSATLGVGYDGNGNVVALVDLSDGSVAAEYEYSPFGKTVRATGTAADSNPFRFSTKYQDPDSGLYYYGQRYYSSELGRWLNRDPIGEDGGPNLFMVAANDTISLIDPFGLYWGQGAVEGLGHGLAWAGGKAWQTATATGRAALNAGDTALTRARMGGGIIMSIPAGDFFDRANIQTTFAPGQCEFLITINGILTDDTEADLMRRRAGQDFGIPGTSIVNDTHVVLGDIVQIVSHEIGLIDVSSQRAARQIRAAYEWAIKQNCPCPRIVVVAHSQGTMVFRRALPLLSEKIRKRIEYHGDGGQTWIGPSSGLGSIDNNWNISEGKLLGVLGVDFVPILGTYANPLRGFGVPFHLGGGRMNIKHVPVDPAAGTPRQGNNHSWLTFYEWQY
jgi:RHS repeat-associated protein